MLIPLLTDPTHDERNMHTMTFTPAQCSAWGMLICQQLQEQLENHAGGGNFVIHWNDAEMIRANLHLTPEQFKAGVDFAIQRGWLMTRDVRAQ